MNTLNLSEFIKISPNPCAAKFLVLLFPLHSLEMAKAAELVLLFPLTSPGLGKDIFGEAEITALEVYTIQ
ncbi:hypothetical protein [Paenibacillus sp. S150]|uniref:hypothetical protein n=1 Tax=Paenibacillus sp. S150 TaxID=2749826 RepID=UPI001C57E0F8|nr:hypothetical protein [Paenibacillus sp. S150]MBW4081543.1 hypothetical protein [Paenibacillus sp. S150]